MKTELTIEQSEELIRKGVSGYKASSSVNAILTEDGVKIIPEQPIFSLSDLMELLPKEIHTDEQGTCWLNLSGENSGWTAGYSYYTEGFGNGEDYFVNVSESELIDTLYQLALWCADNGYLNKE